MVPTIRAKVEDEPFGAADDLIALEGLAVVPEVGDVDVGPSVVLVGLEVEVSAAFAPPAEGRLAFVGHAAVLAGFSTKFHTHSTASPAGEGT